MKRTIILTTLIFAFAHFLSASVRSNIGSGNRAYKKENYDVALEKYGRADMDKPNSPEITFNVGDVYYKTGAYEDALKSYEKATYSKDVELQGKAYYNMGNSLFRMNKLPEAIQFYKKALELNSGDMDAKFNVEFAQKKIKDNMDKNKKQSEQNKEDKDKNKDKDKGKDKGKDKDKDKGKDKDKEKEENKEKKEGMSKEDAQRLLDSTGNEKKPKEKANVKIPLFKMPEKDW